MLEDAGFEEVTIPTVEKSGDCQPASNAAIALVQGTPLIGQLWRGRA
jgi:hypothetical protein